MGLSGADCLLATSNHLQFFANARRAGASAAMPAVFLLELVDRGVTTLL
jgi:hypothetical protein